MLKATSYKGLELYNLSKKLVITCYELTHELPAEEKNNFTRYIRTAAISLHINIAQAILIESKKRKKFMRNARSALIIIDAAVEILVDLQFATEEQIEVITSLSSSCYQMLDELY
jgi:four helix bundle protein